MLHDPKRNGLSATLARGRGGETNCWTGRLWGSPGGWYRPLGAFLDISGGGFFVFLFFVFWLPWKLGALFLWGGKDATDVMPGWDSSAKFWMFCQTFKYWMWALTLGRISRQELCFVDETSSLLITCHNIGNYLHTVSSFSKIPSFSFSPLWQSIVCLSTLPLVISLFLLSYTNKSGLSLTYSNTGF